MNTIRDTSLWGLSVLLNTGAAGHSQSRSGQPRLHDSKPTFCGFDEFRTIVDKIMRLSQIKNGDKADPSHLRAYLPPDLKTLVDAMSDNTAHHLYKLVQQRKAVWETEKARVAQLKIQRDKAQADMKKQSPQNGDAQTTESLHPQAETLQQIDLAYQQALSAYRKVANQYEDAQNALAEVILPYVIKAVRYFRSGLKRRRVEAEDVIQNAFLRLWRALQPAQTESADKHGKDRTVSYDPKRASFSTFAAYRVVQSAQQDAKPRKTEKLPLSLDKLMQDKADGGDGFQPADPKQVSPNDAVPLADFLCEAARETNLHPTLRRALELEVEGYTQAEIAKRLGVSKKVAGGYLQTAKQKLARSPQMLALLARYNPGEKKNGALAKAKASA